MLRLVSPQSLGVSQSQGPLGYLWEEESYKETSQGREKAWGLLHNLGIAELQAKPHDPQEEEKKTAYRHRHWPGRLPGTVVPSPQATRVGRKRVASRKALPSHISGTRERMTLESLRWMGPQTPFISCCFIWQRRDLWSRGVTWFKECSQSKRKRQQPFFARLCLFWFPLFLKWLERERETFRYNHYNVNNFFDSFPVQGATVKSAVQYMCTASYTYLERMAPTHPWGW